MKRLDFATALRAADRDLKSAPIPPAVAARLERRLFQRPRVVGRRRAVFAWAFAAVAACVTGFVVLRVHTPQAVVQPPLLGWLELGQRSPDLVTSFDAHHETVVVEQGTCTLRDGSLGLAVENVGPLELRREQDAMRIVRGHLEVRVHPRHGLRPVRLLVSHGSIEVIGTYFTVDQGNEKGSVVLHEGTIRFQGTAGPSVELAPGQRLDWPQPEPVLDTGPQATAAPSVPPAASRVSVVERLEQIQGFRSRGQWARAAEELTDLLREPLPSATRERLSYELGSISTYQIRDAARACAHWRAHQKAYPKGRYRTEVDQAQRSLRCDEPKR